MLGRSMNKTDIDSNFLTAMVHVRQWMINRKRVVASGLGVSPQFTLNVAFEVDSTDKTKDEKNVSVLGETEVMRLDPTCKFEDHVVEIKFEGEIVQDICDDDSFKKVLLYIDEEKVKSCRVVCKTFYRKINKFLCNGRAYKKSMYERMLEGELHQGRVYPAQRQYLSDFVFSFVVDSYVEVVRSVPLHLLSLCCRSCSTFDAMYLMFGFLHYLTLQKGSSRYYYYLDCYCQALQYKYKWLIFVMFEFTVDFNDYIFL